MERIVFSSTTELREINVTLSEVEFEIVKDIRDGMNSKEISEKRGCSRKTIETHRFNILKKTGCKNSVQLIVVLFRKGLLT